MAATPAPLVWDFYNEIGEVDSVGGNVHYYDTAAQRLYLCDGLATNTTKVIDGHWEESVYGEKITIDNTPYTLFSVDHPYNGTLFMTATDGTDLYYLRYVYATDISDLIESGTWKTQIDNPIAQISVNVQNVSAAMFAGDATLFNPGAKLTLSMTLGGSEPYPIGVAYIDQVPYDRLSQTVPISGRNSIGYYLKDQTFDLENVYAGLSHEIFESILTLAGLRDYDIQIGTGEIPFAFSYDTTLLDGLEKMLNVYIPWKFLELPDGKIVIGNDAHIQQYQSNSYYTFEAEKEVFSRKTSKRVDGAYTHVLATGKDGAGAGHAPVKLPVRHFDFWAIGSHKTIHVEAPDGLTSAEFAAYAADVAERLQYVGIGEGFVGPLRPQILVGDVAEIYYTGETQSTSLGLITEVTQHFGRQGFFTDFVTDSGGVITDGDNYTIISRAAALNGYNRRARMADLIKILSK